MALAYNQVSFYHLLYMYFPYRDSGENLQAVVINLLLMTNSFFLFFTYSLRGQGTHICVGMQS